MKFIFLNIAALFFPWLVLVIYGNPVGALLAAVLQVTVIGWPLASLWAFRILRDDRRKRRHQQKGE